jgi:hypothetical protein
MLSVRRSLLATILGAAALLVPRAALADSLHADFDGDGVSDHIEVGAKSIELAVRLSNGRALQRLQADDLILRFVVADVNRDGHPDVVASTRRSGLEIWINKGRGLFARSHRGRYGPRPAKHTIGQLTARPADDSVCNDRTRVLIATSPAQNERPEAAHRAPVRADNLTSKFFYARRVSRGPPPLRLS